MKSIGLHVFCMVLGTFLLIHYIEGNCRFPREWKGRWYQFGLGDLLIRSSSVSTKGSCTEQHRDYYIFENREKWCYQCLLMIKRHRNIIQYKETYCMTAPSNAFKDICSQIQVEATMYTLVREPTSPIPAPFDGTFDVDYDDGATGFCSQPMAHAQYCQAKNVFKFSFKHCKQWALWQNRELTFETLATWRDGSDYFMYGLFSGRVIANKDEGYRCFKYEHYGPDVFLAMSADATCRGLTSARIGPIVYKFTKSLSGHRTPQCEFPSWGNDVTWFDLTGTNNYVLSEGERVLSIQTRNFLHQVEIKSNISCIDKTDEGNDEFTLSVLITEECSERYQCVGYKKLFHGVLGLYTGPPSSQEMTATQCSSISANIGSVSKQILLSSPVLSGKVMCPLNGAHHLSGLSDDCDAYIEVGCRSTTEIEVHFSCNQPTKRLDCVTWWNEGDDTYLLVRDKDSVGTLINCWQIKDDGTIYSLDVNSCDTEAPQILPFHFPETEINLQGCDSTKQWSKGPTSLSPTTTTTDKITTIIHTPRLISKSTSPISIGKSTQPPTETQTAKYVLIGKQPTDDEDDTEASADHGYNSEIDDDSDSTNEIDTEYDYDTGHDRILNDEPDSDTKKESHKDNDRKENSAPQIIAQSCLVVFALSVFLFTRVSLT